MVVEVQKLRQHITLKSAAIAPSDLQPAFYGIIRPSNWIFAFLFTTIVKFSARWHVFGLASKAFFPSLSSAFSFGSQFFFFPFKAPISTDSFPDLFPMHFDFLRRTLFLSPTLLRTPAPIEQIRLSFNWPMYSCSSSFPTPWNRSVSSEIRP